MDKLIIRRVFEFTGQETQEVFGTVEKAEVEVSGDRIEVIIDGAKKRQFDKSLYRQFLVIHGGHILYDFIAGEVIH